MKLLLLLILLLGACSKESYELSKGSESILVAFGDSLTEGYGAVSGESYPDYLEAYMDINIINKGLSGDTTSSARERFERDVLSLNPDVVILELGANDYFRQYSIEETRVNLEYMVGELSTRGILVYVVKFYPKKSLFFILQKNKKKAYDQIYEDLEGKYKVEVIENMWDGVYGKDEYMSDEIHPNGQGYELFAKNIYKNLKDLAITNGLEK